MSDPATSGDWRVVISTTDAVYQTECMYSRERARILGGMVKRGEYTGEQLKIEGTVMAVWAEQDEKGETVGPI